MPDSDSVFQREPDDWHPADPNTSSSNEEAPRSASTFVTVTALVGAVGSRRTTTSIIGEILPQ